MARQQSTDTIQLGARIGKQAKKLLDEYVSAHPLQPPLARIVELAILEYVKNHPVPKEEPAPKRPK